jgi:glycolate oxidase iron-sulfur subunit
VLQSIPGIDFVELDESDWCCGSAGIYNIINFEESMKILKRKMENIRRTQADILVTGNPGCLAQLRYGLQKDGMDIELLHPVTLLRRGYGN